MNYFKLAEESRKLYHAFRNSHWNDNEAYELTKTCIREFPIFREMIESDPIPENIIGYVYFVDGNKEPVYKTENVSLDSVKIYTENEIYRQIKTKEYDGTAFMPVTKVAYYKYEFDTGHEWTRVFDIDRLEFII